jgi:hypothetical protein
MSIPQPQKDEQGKIVGDFYPLQREEIIAMRKAKILCNAGYVHLALRYENPFCDRPVEIFPKEFALRWQMPESSVYAAISALKDAGAIEIKYGKVIIQWTSEANSDQPNDSQQESLSRNLESLQTPRIESRFSEVSLDSQKGFSDSRKPDIYRSRARSSDISNKSDRSDVVAATTTTTTTEAAVSVEVFVEPEEEPTEDPQGGMQPESTLSGQSQALIPTKEPEATHEEECSAGGDAKTLKQIERIAHNWKLRPWRASAQHFKPEMVKAVWQCNPGYYSLQGTNMPNQHHILKSLQLLEKQLKSLDSAAINAYHELNRYWSTAQALANPHVQHAFVAAAAQSKEQIAEMERQRKIQETAKLFEDL